MQVDFWAATDSGRQREHNEDNFLVDKNLRLFIVADGMGGHAAGEVASALCVREVRDAVAQTEQMLAAAGSEDSDGRGQILRMLEHSVQSACSAIYKRAQSQSDKRGMGTTCTLLLLAGQRGFIAHVGDSRVYLVRQGQVHQLSEDHSLVNELIRRGKIKHEDIDNPPYKDYKHAVTRAVGVYESVEVDTLDFDVLPGDQFVICSDGLHRYLEDSEETLVDLLGDNDTQLTDVTKSLIGFANAGGGHDNITTIVVRIPITEEADQRAEELSVKIEALRRMPLFRYLSYTELVRVLNITTVQSYEKGATIISEGAPAKEMFILLAGSVRLHKNETYITSLDDGAHFGEMGLVDSSPRSASASAESSARLLVVPREAFFHIIREESKLSVKLLWSFVQVLAQRLRKTTEDLSGARYEASLPDLTSDAFDDSTFSGSATVPGETEAAVAETQPGETVPIDKAEDQS